MPETTVVYRSSIGTISEYRPNEDWQMWVEQYSAANYIEADKKVPVLLTLIGEQAYKTLRNLCDTALPKTKTYDQLCEILKSQFSKRISVFKERIEFYNLRQFDTETVRQWYVRIKNKASSCKFGTNLNEILKDRFVSGLRGKVY